MNVMVLLSGLEESLQHCPRAAGRDGSCKPIAKSSHVQTRPLVTDTPLKHERRKRRAQE
jgi:hypothetical protein